MEEMAEGGVDVASTTAPAAAKVRVVRCPKCQKLLPELAGFTVYRCGGCNATLQAKHTIPVNDTSSEKSDEEGVVISENPEYCPGNMRITSNPSSENDQESYNAEFRGRQRVGAGNLNGGASSTSRSRLASTEPDEPRLDDLGTGGHHGDGHYMRSSKAPADICNGGVDERVKSNVEDDARKELQGERTYKSQKVQNNPIYKDEERDGLGVLRRTPRTLLEGSRFSPYSHEGPSSSHPISSYGYHDDVHVRHHNRDRSERVESLEQDRADLLRKLDELRDQLSHSCDIKGKTNERDTMNRTASNPYGRRGQGTWFEKNSSMNRTSARHFPSFNGNNADMQNFYTPLHVQNEGLRYGDPFESQQLRRAPYHPSHQYPQRSTESYMYGQFEPDPGMSYPRNVFYHQPACSCPHCCNMHWQASVQDAHPVFSNQGAPYLANGHGLYPLGNPFMLGSSNYNHRGTNGSLLSREPRMHQRSVLAKRSGHSCKAIAGGAPFIVCNNCSELLQVPHKLSSVGKNLYKLRCGSCSQVISFKIEGKRLNISPPPSTLNTSLEPINNSADVMTQGLQCPGPSNCGLVNSYSGDYESSCCNIQSTDEMAVLSSPLPVASHETIEKEYGLNLSESENMLGLSSSPSSSDDNESTESMVCQREAPSSTELKPHAQAKSRGPGLPLREHFGYPSSEQAVSRPGEGSRSKRFDQEKMVAPNSNLKQNSIKDVSITTEIDLATDKYPNSCLSQDSLEISKEEEHPRISKGGDSFFTGLIKKSFKDFPRFNQSLESNKTKVSINGHHIPDRLVKKAEKLAGPICPGEYWYDYGAGFWGVIGQPCLGIIPPFIEEFNYPMPKNCAGGNTDVTVNGRELHQKDLNLLVGRGLPSDSGRSYRIDISGQVLDEVTGEELDSLGKLAPTVEKLKHGFGLRITRILAG